MNLRFNQLLAARIAERRQQMTHQLAEGVSAPEFFYPWYVGYLKALGDVLVDADDIRKQMLEG